MPTNRAAASRAAFDRGSAPPLPQPIDSFEDDIEPTAEPSTTSPCIAVYLQLPKETRARILQGDPDAIAEWQDATGEEV